MNNSIKYFEKIMTIPRPSGKEKLIADYLCDFAKKRKLDFFRDENNNVIIKKDNNSSKTIILQGHIDMVCVAEKTIVKNFEKDGIDWFVDDDFIRAKGTSLGADNGVGVAIILSLLDEKNKEFPNIEAVFTVEEETTMKGAHTLDYSKISGKTLLSLDGDREAVLEVSSAGMCDIKFEKKLKEMKRPDNTNVYSVEVSNLIGGHSGEDINKNRLSAIEILAKILKEINPVGIISIFGGERTNVISTIASCEFVTEKSMGEVSYVCSKYRSLTEENENHPTIFASKLENKEWIIYDEDEIVAFINDFKQGVLHYNENNFPITSQNLGILRLSDGVLTINASVRSSVKDEEIEQLKTLEKISKKYNFNYKLISQNPFFSYRENSKIRETLKAAYKKLYHTTPRERHIHAGVEGGVFSQHITDLDLCVIAADIYDMHSTHERVSVKSIGRVYDWVYETLIEFNK